MQNKPLLAGIVGFILGGLLVSVAATTFDKPAPASTTESKQSEQTTPMSMDDMSAALKGKTGDDYDKLFIEQMIAHHEGAVDMAKQSAENAKHDELKQMSQDIITAQEKEIQQMKQWYEAWGYTPSTVDSDGGMESMDMMGH